MLTPEPMAGHREFIEFMRKLESVELQPTKSTLICVSEDSHAIELILDPGVSYYSEWIEGEGGDIGLYRSQEAPHQVVGVRLPLKHRRVDLSYEPKTTG